MRVRSQEAHQRIQQALRVELRKRLGHIRDVERQVSRSEGYLRRVCRGDRSISLELLLKSLEALEVEPGTFFSHALGSAPSFDTQLRALAEAPGARQRLARLERAAHLLRDNPPAAGPASPPDTAALIAAITRREPTEQRRRLRTVRKYRSATFARAYLTHLEALSHEAPKDAARLAEAVAADLLPELSGERRELAELYCRAIGIHASALRMLGEPGTAAAAIVLALDLARSQELTATTAELLQRGAYVLGDQGQLTVALSLLDQALVIWFDLESRAGIGSAGLDRGVMLARLGKHRDAVRVLEKALTYSDPGGGRPPRTFLVAQRLLARVYLELGELERAEEILELAIRDFGVEGEIHWARMVWLQGEVAFARGDHATAEHRFRRAGATFDQRQGPEKVLVPLDLVRVLLVQGKSGEAHDTALGMTRHLERFRAKKTAEEAVMAFLRDALAGRLALPLVEQLRQRLGGGTSRRSGAEAEPAASRDLGVH